jgi:small-conductance mechanosensitive channel
VSHLSFAQNDSTAIKDSIILSEVRIQNKRLLELEKQRLSDSVKKAELEQQILALNSTDDVKRQQLNAQIELLKEKEEQLTNIKKGQIDALKKTAIGHPVMGLFEDTLFLIHTRLGSFSAGERADAVSRRIKKLAGTVGFSNDSLKIIQSEATFDLTYGESILISVTENDALWNATTDYELAKSYKTIIGNTIEKYRAETNWLSISLKIGLALLVLLTIYFLIKYVTKLFNWLAKKITHQKGKRIKGIKFKNYTFFDAQRQVNALLLVNKVLKWVTILFAIYIALPVLFGIFPWTESFANTMFGYIFNPVKKILLSFWKFLPNLITIVVIIIVFRYVLKAIHFLKNEIENGKLTIAGFYPDWANPTYQLVKVLIIAFMIVVIFPYLPGSDSPIFQGISVFLGFLFTFGSAGSLSNVIAGLVLTYMRLFKIGDRVKIGEVVGDVIEKSTLVTRVRTIKNEIISIPNSTVMNSHTINYSSDAPEKGLIIHTTVTIGYDVPWKDICQALIDAAIKTDLVLKEPTPFVLQTSLEDFYVAYQINAYVREANKQATIYSNLHQNIQDVCNERGIEILSPHYRAARDGNMSTIPLDYLPKDYKAPAFNINTNKTKES